MLNARYRVPPLAFASLLSLSFAPPAAAQCAGGLPESQEISVESDKSFQAEYFTLITPDSPAVQVFQQHGPQSVARDFQGRVRIDHFLNMVKTKSPDGTVNEVERHTITICDPNYRRAVQLDTAEKTATVFALRPVPANTAEPGNAKQQTFCSWYFSRPRYLHKVDSGDLGHRIIEGFDAQGLRTTTVAETSRVGMKPVEATVEEWCSDELAAIVLKVTSTKVGRTQHTVGLTHIVRSEPDPALFEIPPDYTILEDDPDQVRPAELPRVALPSDAAKPR